MPAKIISRNEIHSRSQYMPYFPPLGIILVLKKFMNAVVCTLHLLLFYVYLESVLFLMFLIVGIWDAVSILKEVLKKKKY